MLGKCVILCGWTTGCHVTFKAPLRHQEIVPVERQIAFCIPTVAIMIMFVDNVIKLSFNISYINIYFNELKICIRSDND